MLLLISSRTSLNWFPTASGVLLLVRINIDLNKCNRLDIIIFMTALIAEKSRRHIYIIIIICCTFLSTQSALHRGGNPLNHHQCAASTWMIRRQPYCARMPTTHTSLLVERRQSDDANQCMGMIRRPWWSEANGRICPECWFYTTTFFFNDIQGFLMTTESQDRGHNLVFPGGLPSRYWPGSALLSFSGQPVLGCRVIWLLVFEFSI